MEAIKAIDTNPFVYESTEEKKISETTSNNNTQLESKESKIRDLFSKAAKGLSLWNEANQVLASVSRHLKTPSSQAQLNPITLITSTITNSISNIFDFYTKDQESIFLQKKTESLLKRNESFALISQAADMGHSECQYLLGMLYCNGYETVTINYERSMHYLTLAASTGHMEATSQLAYRVVNECGYSNLEKVCLAVDLWKFTSGSGCNSPDASIKQRAVPLSQLHLGIVYEIRNGKAKRDEEISQHWFQLAIPQLVELAEQGDPDAILHLGFCYHNGYGVVPNHPKGNDYFHQASFMGHAVAQYHLGECYLRGLGVDKNMKQALHFFHLSCKQGFSLASIRLGELYWKGENGIEKDIKRSEELLQMVIKGGDKVAAGEADRLLKELKRSQEKR